ncbi:hypothetical protein PSPO01_15567 [Paraphaeosphaeria sporulosa]
MVWSPRAIREARVRKAVTEQEKEEAELKKVEMKELAAANKLYKKKIEEERRQARVKEKEERVRIKAEERQAIDARKATRAAVKQARDSTKAIQQSQRCKPISSLASTVKQKPTRRGVGARSHPKPVTPPPPARTHTTRSGRTATLYR